MISLVRGEGYYIRATKDHHLYKTNNVGAIRKVIQEVSAISGFHHSKIMGKSRVVELIEWRILVSYICRMNAYGTFNSIGRELGGLHHSSVLNHFERAQNMIDCNDRYFMTKYNLIKHLIK